MVVFKKGVSKLQQWVFIISFFIVSAKANSQELNKSAFTPMMGVKTNILYDATGSMNLGIEFRTGSRTSLDISGNWNPWIFSDNKMWKHMLVQPELRWWTKETFKGHFLGAHTHYSYYNVDGIPNPPFSQYMADNRFQGWLVGAGISYGYRWNFNKRWGLEANVGLGYAYMDYKRYERGTDGEQLSIDTKHYFGPTKAGLSIIYNIGNKNKSAHFVSPIITDIVPIPQIIVFNQPQFAINFVKPLIDEEITNTDSDDALLDFFAGKSNIFPDYKNNVQELKKIYKKIEKIQENPNATINKIKIIGYASPEGTFQDNLMLSKKRAIAIKELLIEKYNLSENIFDISAIGEDWSTLDMLISKSDMIDKQASLNIIRNIDIFEGREKKLMDLSAGRAYRYMLINFFPQLRRCEYEIQYTTNELPVEIIKGTFYSDPNSITLIELFKLINTYEVNSDEYYELYKKAAMIYTDNDIVNSNVAACALSRNDTKLAFTYLNKINEKDDIYWINMGILFFMEGNMEISSECFDKLDDKTNKNYLEFNNYKTSKNGAINAQIKNQF